MQSKSGDGTGTMGRLSAALAHHRAGRLREAEAVYGEILDRQPGHPEALNLLGVLHAQQGHFDRARPLLEAAVAAKPGNTEFLGNLARTLAGAGEDAAAADLYRKCLTLDSSNLAVLMDLGSLSIRMDLVGEAAECFQRAAEVKPDLAEAYEGLGFARLREGREDEAIEAFRRASSLSPENPGGHSNLGGLLLEQGRTGEAVAAFRQAVSLAPKDAALRTNLGVALYADGKPEEALDAYDSALRLAPRDVRALSAKGTVLAELGREAESGAIFDYEGLLKFPAGARPEGFADLAAFNRALCDYVQAHPSLMADRPGKTTRLGSQTGNLWPDQAPPIAALRGLVQAALADYFSDPALRDHPYAPRPPARHRVVAWATILNSGGHQAPHNHPGGAVSGVYYAQVPALVGESSDSKEGWLEFGRPNPKFGAKDPKVLHQVCPKEGLFVLFPSHFWHRTLPFESAEKRISIAFDLVPVA